MFVRARQLPCTPWNVAFDVKAVNTVHMEAGVYMYILIHMDKG